MLSSILPLFHTRGTLTVTRATVGTVTAGRYTPGTPTTFAIVGSVQAPPERKLKGDTVTTNATDELVLYTTTALRTAGHEGELPADQVAVQGRVYHVTATQRWDLLGSTHYVVSLAYISDEEPIA
jgi:hypothetical protein